MPDYIPSGDADFNTWQTNFINTLKVNSADFGLSETELTALTEAQRNWAAAYATNTTAQASAKAAREAKDAARDSFVQDLRAMARRVQAQHTTTDAHRALLGLNAPSSTRTPTGVPRTRPIAQVDTSQRLRHTISFSDEETPNSRAKPMGVLGCEIWVKTGDPAPTDPSQLRFLAMDTSTPYIAQYGGEEAGRTAHYMLRWVNSKGEQGAWSQTVSATITG